MKVHLATQPSHCWSGHKRKCAEARQETQTGTFTAEQKLDTTPKTIIRAIGHVLEWDSTPSNKNEPKVAVNTRRQISHTHTSCAEKEALEGSVYLNLKNGPNPSVMLVVRRGAAETRKGPGGVRGGPGHAAASAGRWRHTGVSTLPFLCEC